MTRRNFRLLLLLAACLAAPLHAQESPLPAIQKNGQAVQMFVDGKPFLMLAGELHNSSATSAEYMQPIWPKLTGLHLNTVIGTASWELVEPTEGKFDFSAVDVQLSGAREHGLRLVLIWFGSWKNASSSYVPLWVKRDPGRFPMATTKSGPSRFRGLAIDSPSPLDDALISADAHAFAALMRHIGQVDPTHTVIMIQVENETGLLGDSRDRSPLAEAAWAQPVPPELLSYLVAHKTALLPELSKIWGDHGFKTSGAWPEVFGAGASGDEIFMAWYIARAVGKVAAAGKAELPIPMCANDWLPQPHMDKPGEYPSGGPVAHLLDVWRAAAPALDLFAPDIYVDDFQGVCASYVRTGNPLFIPESRASVPNLFWAIAHGALGYSPFGIEDLATYKPLAAAYETLNGMAPLILNYEAQGKVKAILEGDAASVAAFDEATGLDLRFGPLEALWDPHAAERERQKLSAIASDSGDDDFLMKPANDHRGFALVVYTAPDEFLIAGSGIVATNARARIGTVDEGRFENGQWIPGRRLNGDENFSGIFIALQAGKLETRKVVTYRNQ